MFRFTRLIFFLDSSGSPPRSPIEMQPLFQQEEGMRVGLRECQVEERLCRADSLQVVEKKGERGISSSRSGLQM